MPRPGKPTTARPEPAIAAAAAAAAAGPAPAIDASTARFPPPPPALPEPAQFTPPAPVPAARSPSASASAAASAAALRPRAADPENDARAKLLSRVLLVLLRGLVVVKHGRRGWPHKRLLWLDTTGAELCIRWGRVENGLSFPEASPSVMRLGAIVAVRIGRATQVLLRSGSERNEALYWSLEGDTRSLDLEASSAAEAADLVAGVRRMVEDTSAMQAELMRLYTSGEWVPAHLRRGAHARNQG